MTRTNPTPAARIPQAGFPDSRTAIRPFPLHVSLRDRIAAEQADDGPRDVLPFALVGSQERREYRLRLQARHAFCRFCGDPIRRRNSTLDHLLPLTQGGGNEPANLALCCEACNSVKSGRTPEQWARDILDGAEPGAKVATNRGDVERPELEPEGVA